jgi:hypothetical protein
MKAEIENGLIDLEWLSRIWKGESITFDSWQERKTAFKAMLFLLSPDHARIGDEFSFLATLTDRMEEIDRQIKEVARRLEVESCKKIG